MDGALNSCIRGNWRLNMRMTSNPDNYSELLVGNVNGGNHEFQLMNGIQIGNLLKFKENQIGPSI